MLGWMPAPFIYGLVSQLAGDTTGNKFKSRLPMGTIIYSVLLTLTLTTVVILRKLRVERLQDQLSKAEQLFQKEQEQVDDGEERQGLLAEEPRDALNQSSQSNAAALPDDEQSGGENGESVDLSKREKAK